MGGQIPNNLAMKLYNSGLKIIGTSPEQIDNAENRHKFSKYLIELKVDQPSWRELTSLEEAKDFCDRVGYPVLIRPSYVLSGAAMSIVLTMKMNLEMYLKKAPISVKSIRLLLVSLLPTPVKLKWMQLQIKVKLFCYAISEHVENAGVHSGDATIVLPPQRTYLETMRRVKIITKEIAAALEITGPFNIQFIAKDNDVKVIECNLTRIKKFSLCFQSS